MKTKLKLLALCLVIISTSLFLFCDRPFEEEDTDSGKTSRTALNFNGEICNGKKILRFNTMAALQQEHYNLYQQYQINNEEEQVLVNYETTHNFYSLRKKDQDMDDGVIPVDPNFDETNFTFDPILETLLNEDGMIIIGNRLYVWDAGCVIQSIPFSCNNYENLLSFYHAIRNNANDAAHSIFIENGIRNTNTCDDPGFDFETISENGGRVPPADKPRLKSKNGCGYDVVVNTALVSCDLGFNTYHVTSESVAPIGTNAQKFYYIKPIFGDAGDIEISTSLLGTYGVITVQDEDQVYGYIVPFSPDFYMRVPNNIPTQCSVTLVSTVNLFTANSCQAIDTVSIDSSCPFTIVAVKNFANENNASWTFSLNSTTGCVIPNSKINWTFGDGTSIQGGFTETHLYNVPCAMQYITVTATIDNPVPEVCGAHNKMFIKGNIPYGNPCTRSNYAFPTASSTNVYNVPEIGGKKVTLRGQLKRNIFNKSVFKNVFKCRVNGTKRIKSIGAIYQPSANNSSCVPSDISTVVPSQETTGKKRNRQREPYPNFYHINAVNPYQIVFTHNGNPVHTLVSDGLYCSQ